jgi:single-stranded-DNA-specific exonuclease
LELPRLLSIILVNRGLVTVAEASAFLQRKPAGSTDPFGLPGMDGVVTRLLQALRGRERICIYGDYDVDGLTATALLKIVLEEAGGQVVHYLPSRRGTGYGLHEAAIRSIAASGVDLVVTVDCGITALREAALARSLGLGLIITDHHEPGPDLPWAEATVNPRLADRGRSASYPFPGLAGVGVAYKVIEALTTTLGEFGRRVGGPSLFDCAPGRVDPADLADLVALGTVADVASLVDENRALVHAGLGLLNPPRRPGLVALRRVAGLDTKRITAYHLGFQLGPRLNAAGRLGDAEQALRLLLTSDAGEAGELAADLDRGNRERQALEERILAEASAEVERTIDLGHERAIVLFREGWHEGIIGIVAARLADRYARPALLVALEGGTGRGSGRGVPGFDLVGALGECGSWLERYGGHHLAAGFEVSRGALDDFAQRFLDVARERLQGKDLVRELRIDSWVEPEDLSAEFFHGLEDLEPFGAGNPEPMLAMSRVGLNGIRTVGEGGRHLKAVVRAANRTFEGIGFGLGALAGTLGRGEVVDIVFRPGLGQWNGVQREELRLVDVRSSGMDAARAGLSRPIGGGG